MEVGSWMFLASLFVPVMSSSYHNQRQVETKSKVSLIRTINLRIIVYCTLHRGSLWFEIGRLIRKLEKSGNKTTCPSQIASLAVVGISVNNRSSVHAAALISTHFLMLHGKCGREEHELCWELRDSGGRRSWEYRLLGQLWDFLKFDKLL